MNVVIAGGGTAGHVNPAIALAKALSGHDVTFVGTSRGVEQSVVPAAGFSLEIVDVQGYDRANPVGLVVVGARAARAVAAAARLLGRLAPKVVVGMGGYVSLPVCLAARARRVPVVIHEQNIVLGLANRLCKPFASAVAVSFAETVVDVGRRAVLTGNPVLPEIAHADRNLDRKRGLARWELDPDRKTLLIFGGSQGAARINEAALGLIDAWRSKSDLQVLHIVGATHVESVRERVARGLREAALIYRVVGFVDRMIEAYSVADLAVCRGGASTVAELGAVGLPAVIVPYPYHRDRQQERQGRVLERAGAAQLLRDDEATTSRIAGLEHLLVDDGVLANMRTAAAAFGRPDAAARLAGVVEDAAA
jgi:UDP-N-acetylglucosamine--N-acetylmuramyl-(pentapeptide) pyrophosphoryl-undecaprenol N-acetylglucosamine transferase